MSLDLVFRRKESSRAFWIICVLTLIVLALIRFYVLPAHDPSLKMTGAGFLADLVEKLLVGVAVTVGIAVVVFWLVPVVDQKSAIHVLDGKDIRTALEEAINRADSWFYKGGTGRYLRSTTAPNITTSARHNSTTKQLRVQLLDPNNISECDHYATYRKGQASSDTAPNTVEAVRIEILATIVCLAQIAKREPRVQLSLSLTNHFSTFRIDMSQEAAIITKEDPREPAFMFSRQSPFFQAYKEEFFITEQQARSINIKEITTEMLEIKDATVLALLGELKLGVGLSEEMVRQIVVKATDKENPYGPKKK